MVARHARYESIPEDFRYPGDGVEPAMESFRLRLNGQGDCLEQSMTVQNRF